MFLSKNWYFSVQKALIYYTFNKSHHNSFILLVFSHVANFRYVANFRFLTLHVYKLWFSTDSGEIFACGAAKKGQTGVNFQTTITPRDVKVFTKGKYKMYRSAI